MKMIKRADGTTSKRGLWDNIRANKGSGKKPTKQMLAQEKKINARSMENGGTNNAGFEALPEYVQAKILSNMGYGENVVNDEIQAYLSTGVDYPMTAIKGIKEAQIPFKETFESYTGKIKPKKIPIDWSTDLSND